ncbi:LamG domain-containing protein, partial [Candidatus Poribacteria bacterium]|nr:LamG domain-containing protein [Candidatus Poribacteria bacterium]
SHQHSVKRSPGWHFSQCRLRIAQDCERPNNVFTGMIDEVRLWNRALSQDDINILKDLSSQATPVDPLGKLSTTWGSLKSVR